MDLKIKNMMCVVLATMLMASGVASYFIALRGSASNAGDGNVTDGTGIPIPPPQPPEKISMGTVFFPEDNDYTMATTSAFESGWIKFEASGNLNIDISADNDTITFSPATNWNGIETVDMIATYDRHISPPPVNGIDGAVGDPSQYFEVTATIIIVVEPVNDPPIAVPELPQINVQSGAVVPAVLNLSEFITDVDSDLTFYAMAKSSGVSLTLSDSVLNLKVPADYVGTDEIIVSATDGEYLISRIAALTVTSPHKSSGLEDHTFVQSLTELFPATLVNVEVLDSGPFSASTQATPMGDWRATIVPEMEWSGHGAVTLKGYSTKNISPIPPDPNVSSADDGAEWDIGYAMVTYVTIDLAIAPVNDPPYFLGILPGTIQMTEDLPKYNVMDASLYFFDPDSTLTFSCKATNGIIIPSMTRKGVVSLVPAVEAFGLDTLTLYASDGEFTASASVPVNVAAVNDPPFTVEDLVVLNTNEDVAVTLELFPLFADVDSVLTYSCFEASNASVTIDQASATASIIPNSEWSGCEILTFLADDGDNITQSAAYLVVTPVNDPPVQTAQMPAMAFAEDTMTTIDLKQCFSDPDSALTYSVETGSYDVMVSLQEGVVTLSAALEWNGAANLKVTASDGQYSIVAYAMVSVLAVNDPPVALVNVADIAMLEDASKTVDLGGFLSDPDSTLTYTATASEHIWATIDGNMMTLVLDRYWNGAGTALVTASDGAESASLTFEIYVTPVNNEPVVVERMKTIVINTTSFGTIDLTRVFSDPDGDTLTYAITPPSGIRAIIDTSTGTASLASVSDWSGNTTLTVTATDGKQIAEAQVDLVVVQTQKASQEAYSGLPMQTGYMLGGGLMLSSSLAVVAFALLARETAMRRPRRSKSPLAAST